MLAEMTWAELMEWRAYFALQTKEKPAAKPKPDSGKAALGHIMSQFWGYQNRRKQGNA